LRNVACGTSITRLTCACQILITLDVCFLKTIGERICYARKQVGLSQAKLAELVGTNPGTIGDKERNRGKPSGPLLIAIEYATGYSATWLSTGKGDPLVPRETESPKSQTASDTAQSDEAELILTEFGAWVRRTVLKSPELTDDIATGIRRLINEVEDKRLPRAAPQDQQGNKAAS
ncbi:MAG: helix-turn-helix domain-containing protein, partial [Rhodospirillales bacterium]|nr:helix-turn-helix domain-containing protein [Rhodospirillales bacterium]